MLVTEVFKEPVDVSTAVNLVNTDPLKVFKFAFETLAADAEVIKLPVTTPISVNLVSTLPDLDSKLFNLPSCVSFVVLAVDADAIKLPLTTPISVNCVNTEPLKVFNAATDVPIVPLPIDALNALIDIETDELKLLMLPSKLIAVLASLPSKYKVALPLC